jgi:hypothetical protein
VHRNPTAIEPLETRRLLAAGNVAYATALTGLDAQTIDAQTTDKSGNLYIAGTLHASVDFNPSPRKTYLLEVAGGVARKFLAKYTPDGALVFARLFSAAGIAEVGDLAVETKSGDLLMVGAFSGAPDFNLGGTSDQAMILRTGEEGTGDGFLLRINKKSGNVTFATRTFGGATADDEANTDVTSDAAGNVYVSGESRRPDPADVHNPLLHRAFVQKLSPTFASLWSKSWGPETGNANAPGGVAIDASGNVYLVGNTTGPTDFERFATVANDTIAGPAAYLVKFAADGTFAFARTVGGTDPADDRPTFNDLAVDAKGNLLAVGEFAGDVDFNPTSKSFILHADAPGTDAFLAKYSPTGGLFYVKQIGADSEPTGGDRATHVALDSQGYIYVGGSFAGYTRFNPGVSKFYKDSFGGQDAFVAKYLANGRLVTAWQFGSANADDELSALTTSPTDDALYLSGPLRAYFGASLPNANLHLRPIDDPDAFTLKLT